MDFYDLLRTAESVKQQNNEATVKRYSTSVSSLKKLPKKTVDAEAVKKFLAKKQQEERQKEKQALLEKQKLFALKSKDAESIKKYHKILKRNKTERVHFGERLDKKASDGVADVDDDYGYASKESSDLHNRLMSSISKSDSKRRAVTETKEPKVFDDKTTYRREEGFRNGAKCNPELTIDREAKVTTPVPMTKKKAPPPPSFAELLKLAQSKQFEPVEYNPTPKKSVAECEYDRPMTAKEKAEYLREKEYRMKKENKSSGVAIQSSNKLGQAKIPKIPKAKTTVSHSSPSQDTNVHNNRTSIDDRKLHTSNSSKTMKEKPSKKEEVRSKSSSSKKSMGSGHQSYTNIQHQVNPERHPVSKVKSSHNDKRNDMLPISKAENKSLNNEKSNGQEVSKNSEIRNSSPLSSKSVNKSLSDKKPPNKLQKSNVKSLKSVNIFDVEDSATSCSSKKENCDIPIKKPALSAESIEKLRARSGGFPNKKVNDPIGCKSPEQSGSSSLSAKIELPGNSKEMKNAMKFSDNIRLNSIPADSKRKDLHSRIQNVLSNDIRHSYPGPLYHSRERKPFKKPPPKRARIESDDEYDSEMDDFIDDGPMGEETNVSHYIKEIFGYDRRKYCDYEDNEECMESNYNDLMKEEFKSTKAGILEDLAEARRKKLLKQKKMSKLK